MKKNKGFISTKLILIIIAIIIILLLLIWGIFFVGNDKVIPKITLVKVESGWKNDLKTIEIEASDSKGIVAYCINTKNKSKDCTWDESTSTTHTYTKEEGTYYIFVKNKDSKISSPKTVIVRNIDKSIPSIMDVAASQEWVNNKKTLEIKTQDLGGSGISAYCINKENKSDTCTWEKSNLNIHSYTKEEGTYYIFVQDAAGNISEPKMINMANIKVVVPLITKVDVQTAWSNKNKTITVNATGGSKLQYCINNKEDYIKCTWQNENTFTKGLGIYFVYVMDMDGTISEGKTVTVSNIETNKPTIVSTMVPTELTNKNKNITIVSSDTGGSGIAYYCINTTNTSNNCVWNYSTSATYTYNKGKGTYYVFVKDAAGNISNSKTVNVTNIETTKPVITDINIVPVSGTTSSMIKVISDITKGATYCISDSNSSNNCKWQTENAFIKNKGTYYVFVKSQAGNISDSKSVTVVEAVKPPVEKPVENKDTTKPTISNIKVSSDTMITKLITITASDNVGISAYCINTSNTSSSCVWDNSTSNTYKYTKQSGTYYVFVKDKSENISDSKSVEVSISALSALKESVPSSGNKITSGTGQLYNTGSYGIRYQGSNPDNYVYFNCSDYNNQSDSTCEIWRIIGVVDGKVKIIRNESIGEKEWSTNNTNNWSSATLQSYLNGEYYNSFTSKTKGLISSTTWYLKAHDNTEITKADSYNYERNTGVTMHGIPTISKNIGLMYLSDFGFAAMENSTCTASDILYYYSYTCQATNWLGGKREWLLNPRAGSSDEIAYANKAGNVGVDNRFAKETRDVRPTLYLNDNIEFKSGNGSSSNKFQILVK